MLPTGSHNTVNTVKAKHQHLKWSNWPELPFRTLKLSLNLKNEISGALFHRILQLFNRNRRPVLRFSNWWRFHVFVNGIFIGFRRRLRYEDSGYELYAITVLIFNMTLPMISIFKRPETRILSANIGSFPKSAMSLLQVSSQRNSVLKTFPAIKTKQHCQRQEGKQWLLFKTTKPLL